MIVAAVAAAGCTSPADLSSHNKTHLGLVVYSMTYQGALVGGAGAAPAVDFAIEGRLQHAPPAGN